MSLFSNHIETNDKLFVVKLNSKRIARLKKGIELNTRISSDKDRFIEEVITHSSKYPGAFKFPYHVHCS